MEESEYERERAANIARNKALLQQLQLDSLSASLTASAKKAAAATPKPKSTPKKSTPRVKKERASGSPAPRRQSSRLAGLPADSEVLKRKFEDEAAEREKAKRTRVAGDLKFELGDKGWGDVLTKEDVENMEEGDLKTTRKRMMEMKLWEDFEPADLKITPERIYHLSFHPTTTKPLIFAGDKVGNFGILSCAPDSGSDEPDITQFKPHARTISSFFIPPSAPETLYTASYDASVRRLDLNAGKSIEVYVHPQEAPFSAINALDEGCNTLLFSTLEGEIGRYDIRTKDPAEVWQCSDKKIGGCHMLPTDRNYFATASLDRTVKIWDLRKMDAPIATHDSRLSVSSAQWSSTGKLATTSYDDTVKIYNPDLAKLARGDVELEAEHSIPHNNQTGRWVTILRAVWQETPEDGVQKLVVANMNRGIDVFGEDGDLLAHLSDQERVSAVPAVARAHPSRLWVAGGTGSGKVVLYM
ncbi:WD repeat-containing protein [Sphaerosporella brunnea]|uniref:DNA damage-binding protein CMR1 n=1 Tax=Sphaerosporella brunnea TaxID=1250544 RepID=A0A5J5F9J4_9PEZI|nr:WD repeat-containing protein [Sphaerosporella brunnea]